MVANPDIVKYIKDQSAAGYGKEQIYQALLNAGWTREEINEAIYDIMGKGSEKPSPAPQKSQAEPKPPSGSHLRRNALIVIGAIIVLIAVLFVFFKDPLLSVLRTLGLPV